MDSKQQELSQRWKKLKILGDLYWKDDHPDMKGFEDGHAAIRRAGNAIERFRSIDAVERYLDHVEKARAYHLRGFIQPDKPY